MLNACRGGGGSGTSPGKTGHFSGCILSCVPTVRMQGGTGDQLPLRHPLRQPAAHCHLLLASTHAAQLHPSRAPLGLRDEPPDAIS